MCGFVIDKTKEKKENKHGTTFFTFPSPRGMQECILVTTNRPWKNFGQNFFQFSSNFLPIFFQKFGRIWTKSGRPMDEILSKVWIKAQIARQILDQNFPIFVPSSSTCPIFGRVMDFFLDKFFQSSSEIHPQFIQNSSKIRRNRFLVGGFLRL